MAREFSSADRGADDNETRARQLILEIAKWPEQEVWDVERLDEASRDEAIKRDNIKPEELKREYARWEDAHREEVRREEAKRDEVERDEVQLSQGDVKRRQARLDETWRQFKLEELGLDLDQVKFKRDDLEPEEIRPDEPRDESRFQRDEVKGEEAVDPDESLVRFFGPRGEPGAAIPAGSADRGSPFFDIRHDDVRYDEEGADNHIGLIAGGVVAGLLIIGGGIYVAYQFLSAQPPAQAPAAAMATAQPAKPPSIVSPQPSPEMTTPPPSATTPRSVAPAPPSQSAPISAPPPLRAASSAGNSLRPRELDPSDPINAPMTLTPETAPPPQNSAFQMRPPAVESPPDASRVANNGTASQPSPVSEARNPIDAPMTLTPQSAPQPQAEFARQPVPRPAR